MKSNLDRLSEQVRTDLEYLRHPSEPWVVPRTHPSGKHVYDVLIVGGGQSGLAISFALLRDRVDNIVVFDRRPAGLEGPWNTTARMRTLRSAKHLPGIELGIPSLTPRAWFTARYSAEAWEKLDKVSKEDWQDYLSWGRRTLNLPVHNQIDVTSVSPEGDLFRVEFNECDESGKIRKADHVLSRQIVLATGVEGSGDWYVPEFISTALPRARYAHAGEAIDFSSLKGKRVAVLGAGASAFDNASTALESGAAEAIVCIRRKDIQRINPQLWMGKAGFLRHFADLSDEWKWHFMHYMFSRNIPAPQSAYDRLSRLRGARIQQDSGWRSARLTKHLADEEIEIETTSGNTIRADFLILAAGFMIDFRLRPELHPFSDKIALWRDRFIPPDGEAQSIIGSYPYLGSSFELIEKLSGTAPYLRNVRNFTYGSVVSMGLSGAAISGLKYSVARLAEGVTRALFQEDAPLLYKSFTGYAEPELVGPVPLESEDSGASETAARSVR